MKIFRKKQQVIIEFASLGDLSNNVEKEEQSDLIQKFLQPPQFFIHLPQIYHLEVEKFKKKVIAFAIQYGIKNQKTTSIFLNFLEHTRDIATNYLKSREYSKAASFYAYCLNFTDPEDEVFMEKFVNIKIDIVNKLVHCLFELDHSEKCDPRQDRQDSRHLDNAHTFMENFLPIVEDYPFYKNLLKSENCLIELNYFYLGKLCKRKRNYSRAIQEYLKVQDIVKDKLTSRNFGKNLQLSAFLSNLKIKTDYKISKCYRQQGKEEQQALYEQMAIKNAKENNRALYLYINRKIRFYEKRKAFQGLLGRLQGKKRIEDQVIKAIQDSKQNQLLSLYDIYQDQFE